MMNDLVAVGGLVVGAVTVGVAIRAYRLTLGAQRAAEETAQRGALLTVANAANEVLAELQRVTTRAQTAHRMSHAGRVLRLVQEYRY